MSSETIILATLSQYDKPAKRRMRILLPRKLLLLVLLLHIRLMVLLRSRNIISTWFCAQLRVLSRNLCLIQMPEFHNSTTLLPYLAQAPCTMSTLEVFQSCPTQHKNLLTTLRALDLDNTNLIYFNVENYKSILPFQLVFDIVTRVVGRKVHRTILDEGDSTSVLSVTCWSIRGNFTSKWASHKKLIK